MDRETENTLGSGGNTTTSAISHASGQLLTYETMNRTADRTCTQKLTIPTLEKQGYTSANMWWRKFVQYIKMPKHIDLSTMTNKKEVLPQFRDQLELELKDIFLWAIGQTAITERTKTVEKENQAHYRYTNSTQYFACTLH